MDVHEVAVKLQKVEVPKTLHELLRQGIDDLCEREHDEGFVIDMGMWHRGGKPSTGQRCMVCLAGAWLSGRGVPDTMGASDEYVMTQVEDSDEREKAPLPSAVGEAMAALNHLRMGEVDVAAGFFGKDDPAYAALNLGMPEYEYDPDLWHEHAERLYDELKKEGL